MNPKCTLPEYMRRDALLQFDRITLNLEEERAARQRFPQYLFFWNDYEDDGFHVSSTPIRLCTCTACGESFEAVRGNYARGKLHHEQCNCPHCGKQVEGIAAHKYRYDMPSLQSFIKIAVARTGKDGALLIETGDAKRSFNWDDLTGTIDWYPTKRYYFSRSGTVEFEHNVMAWAYGSFERPTVTWQTTKTIGEPFQPNMMYNCNYSGEYSVIGLAEALERSHLKYCQIFEFYQRRASADLDGGKPCRGMMKYLAWACEHPQIEMAVKLGLEEAVEDLVINGRKNAKYLNWKATKPNELLRMLPQDARTFLRAGMDFGDLKNWRESGRKLRLSKYVELAGQVGGTENFRELADCCRTAGCTPEQGVRYVLGLIPRCARYAAPPIKIIRTWKDYLSMAGQLDLDLTEKTVAMPKDLQQRHDNSADTIKCRKNEKEQKKYERRRRQLEKKYEFTLGELCVLVPASAEEIVREGRTLHHCVGGYAARHIEGKVTILFIRHRRRPERSFLTVELAEDRGLIRIRQIHGYRNENYAGAWDPQLKHGAFLETWLAWVNSGSERDRNGLPVLLADGTMEVPA